MTSQPHVFEVGAFDPGEAFTRTFHNLAHLIEGLGEDPDAIPDAEIMRAAITAIDLLRLVADITCQSMMSDLAQYVDPQVYQDNRAAYNAAASARTPEQESDYRRFLLRKVADFFPHETTLPPIEDGSPE